jgi:hypothetical protein
VVLAGALSSLEIVQAVDRAIVERGADERRGDRLPVP